MGRTPLLRCDACIHNPKMTSLNAKIVNDVKVRKLMPVGAICWECMTVKMMNPYKGQVTNIRLEDPKNIYCGILKKGMEMKE